MKRLLLLVWAILLASSLAAQTVDDLFLMTENYAPINFKKDGRLQGISVDTMVEMLKLVGSKQTRKDIRLFPWARGYKMALEQKNTVLFVMTRSEAREPLFQWVGPLVPSNIVLMAKKSQGIQIKSKDDLLQFRRIGAIRDDIGHQLLLQLGIPPKQIHRTTSPTSAVQMLNLGRIDMWAYGRIVALWYIKEFGFDPNDYEEVYTLKQAYQYFAFHKDTPPTLIKQFQEALDQVKASPQFEEIVNKYLY